MKHAVPGRPLRPVDPRNRRAARQQAFELWVFDHHIDLVGVLLLIALGLASFLQFGGR